MNSNKLYLDTINKKYTDIELVLQDKNVSVTMNLHKNILACSCDYFEKMFDFGSEKNKNQITIIVPNAKIVHDIILTFYGEKINSTNYPDWEHLLRILMCRSFLCLDNDVTLLHNIKVPAEGFNLLLETINVFDIDDKLM